MIFDNLKDIQDALKIIKDSRKGTKMHYPVAFKKAVIAFMKTSGTKAVAMAQQLGINDSTLYYWIDQDKRELYSLYGAYCVSQKSKDINAKINAKIQKKIAKLQKKLALVKQCSQEGIKVANEA